MENFFYYYVIIYNDEINSKNKITNGITYGDTLAEAIQNLAEYYGDSNIVDIKCFSAVGEGGNCLEMQDFVEFEKSLKNSDNNNDNHNDNNSSNAE